MPNSLVRCTSANASSPYSPTQASSSASPPKKLESRAHLVLERVNVEHRHRRIDGGDAFPDALKHLAGVLTDPRVQNHLAPAGIRLQKRHVDDRLDLAPRIAVPGILDHADD